MKKYQWIIFILFFIIAGCTSSRITTSWKAENLVPKQYNKILVLGLINEPDRSIREKMEEHILGDLKALGYNAVCACDEFNPKSFEALTEMQAIDKLTKSGIDAVLTIVLLNKTKEKYYVPGRVEYSPYIIYHNRFFGYYRTMYERVYTPGYYAETTKYFWESNLYEMGTKNLLYSAQSESFDPVSTQALAHEYGLMIVNDMVSKHALTRQIPGGLK